jgi:hypothetical protein
MIDNFIIKNFKAHEFGSIHMHQATIIIIMANIFPSKMIMMIALDFATHLKKFIS